MANIEFDYTALKLLIDDRGYTQKRLATESGINPSYFSSKLSGAYRFTQSEIRKICDILEIPAEHIGYYFFTKKVWKNSTAVEAE